MKLIHILVAEDNDADVILFQEALQHHQIEHELHIAGDGQIALDYVARMGTTPEAPCPDVMLLDLNLPKVDGPTILEEFRKHPECQHTPVVIVTSSDAEQDRAEVAVYGPIRYFRKPFDFDAFMELGAVIREVLTGTGSGRESGIGARPLPDGRPLHFIFVCTNHCVEVHMQKGISRGEDTTAIQSLGTRNVFSSRHSYRDGRDFRVGRPAGSGPFCTVSPRIKRHRSRR